MVGIKQNCDVETQNSEGRGGGGGGGGFLELRVLSWNCEVISHNSEFTS